MKKKISGVILIVILLVFAIISIIHIINLNTTLMPAGSNMLYGLFNNSTSALNGLVFLYFIIIISVSYLIIIKKEKKKEEKTNDKKLLKYAVGLIIITSILSYIILPNNSGDVYYYMAVGRLSAKYNVNSYEENFVDILPNYNKDEVIVSSPAYNTTFAYGGIWYLICKIFGLLTINNNTVVSLMIFKLGNLIIHFLNCYLVYKISKKNKIRNMLIYAINPLVILEGLINVHNDLYMVTTILLALYFKQRDKIGLAVASIATGALIKYIPVLLLPYILNKEKSKLRVLAYLSEAFLIYILFNYMIMGSLNNIFAFLVQTTICMNSLYLILLIERIPYLPMIIKIGKIFFIIMYLIALGYMLIKKPKEEQKLNIYKWIIILFILLCITNFRTWYILWLFPFIPIMEDKSRLIIIVLSLVGEIANVIMYYFGESYIHSSKYFYTVVIGTALIMLLIKSVNQNQKTKILQIAAKRDYDIDKNNNKKE